MTEVSSTNIDDLPNSGFNSDVSQNITMKVDEKPTEYKPLTENTGPQMPDSNTMNEILSQTNQLASNGNLDIPMRDIPVANDYQIDEQVNSEYMKNMNHPDYIDNWERNQDIIYDQQKENNKQDSLEFIYQQFQLPILIMLLYFFFHLPVVNRWFHKNLTFCFMNDGNMNFQGYVLKSVIFAFLFYIIHINISYLSNNMT